MKVLQDADVIARPELRIVRFPLRKERQAEGFTNSERNSVTDAEVAELRVRKEDERTGKEKLVQRIVDQTDSGKENI